MPFVFNKYTCARRGIARATWRAWRNENERTNSR